MAAAAGSNELFVSESEGNRIRKIDFSATPPVVSTLASGFNKPRGVSIHPTDTTFLAVADSLNHAIRRVHTLTGVASTIAGRSSSGDMDGIGTNARFNEPFDVAFANNDLLAADLANKKLRLITAAGAGWCDGYQCQRGRQGAAGEPGEHLFIRGHRHACIHGQYMHAEHLGTLSAGLLLSWC